MIEKGTIISNEAQIYDHRGNLLLNKKQALAAFRLTAEALPQVVLHNKALINQQTPFEQLFLDGLWELKHRLEDLGVVLTLELLKEQPSSLTPEMNRSLSPLQGYWLFPFFENDED